MDFLPSLPLPMDIYPAPTPQWTCIIDKVVNMYYFLLFLSSKGYTMWACLDCSPLELIKLKPIGLEISQVIPNTSALRSEVALRQFNQQ